MHCYLLQQVEFKVQTLYSPSNDGNKETDLLEDWSYPTLNSPAEGCLLFPL